MSCKRASFLSLIDSTFNLFHQPYPCVSLSIPLRNPHSRELVRLRSNSVPREDRASKSIILIFLLLFFSIYPFFDIFLFSFFLISTSLLNTIYNSKINRTFRFYHIVREIAIKDVYERFEGVVRICFYICYKKVALLSPDKHIAFNVFCSPWREISLNVNSRCDFNEDRFEFDILEEKEKNRNAFWSRSLRSRLNYTRACVLNSLLFSLSYFEEKYKNELFLKNNPNKQ